jgi:hypothetical protein
MKYFSCLVLAFALGSMGCASEDTDAGDTGEGGGSAQSSGATTGAGSGTTGGTGGNGGSTGEGGGGDGKLFPIAVGYSWTYEVVNVGEGAICNPGQYSSTILSSAPLEGKEAFEVTSFCSGSLGNSQIAAGVGDEVFTYFNAAWVTAIDPILEEGHTWSFANTTLTWHEEGSVTVPAGTFTDCWTAQQSSPYMSFTTYCRGVGPVRSSATISSSGFDAKLASKSF